MAIRRTIPRTRKVRAGSIARPSERAPRPRTHAGRRVAQTDDEDSKPVVVAVKKWAMSSSGGQDMDYDTFARAKGSDLPAIFGSAPLTSKQAIRKLIEMGWDPSEFDEIEAQTDARDLDEDERVDMLQDWADANGRSDNTYNWSWWGPTLNFTSVQEPDESGDPWKPAIYFVRAHRGGDVRGNYGAYSIFYLKAPGEEAPWYDWRLTVELEMADGSTVLLDAEGDEAYHFYVVEDPTGTFRKDHTVKYDDIMAAFDFEEHGQDIW